VSNTLRLTLKQILAKSLLHALERGIHVIPATFTFDGKVLHHAGHIPFISDPRDDELFALADIAANAAKRYNMRFGPEANAVLAGVSRLNGVPYIYTVFYGIFCQSCGLYDYFDDYGIILADHGVRSVPESVAQFGNTYIVRFRVKEAP